MGSVGKAGSTTTGNYNVGSELSSKIGSYQINSSQGSLAYTVSSDEIYIDHIIVNTDSRQQGAGTSMLNNVKNLSDKTGTPIRIFASPIEEGMTTKQLVDWYKRNGFKVVESHGSLGARMIYTPKKKVITIG